MSKKDYKIFITKIKNRNFIIIVKSIYRINFKIAIWDIKQCKIKNTKMCKILKIIHCLTEVFS